MKRSKFTPSRELLLEGLNPPPRTLEPSLFIDHAFEWTSLAQRYEISAKPLEVSAASMLARPGSVGCHHAIFKSPQRAVGGSGFNRGYVEGCSADNSILECFFETRTINDLAPGDVQKNGCWLHLFKKAVVTHSPGVLGERQAYC